MKIENRGFQRFFHDLDNFSALWLSEYLLAFIDRDSVAKRAPDDLPRSLPKSLITSAFSEVA